MSEDVASVQLAELPDEVRLRVLSLTADVLGLVPTLPAPLRKVADFAPARRARLGATAIVAALSADDDFRERVAVQVEAKLPAARAGLDGEAPDADPVELAALSWLTRPDEWEAALASALTTVVARTVAVPSSTDDTDRWRDKAQAAEQALRDARARHRADLADLKADNAQLRRKLGEERAKLKEAVATADAAGVQLEDSRRQAEAAASAQDREIRQLRAHVERFGAEAQSERRTARADRDEATIRARLLLDTVIDAANGLRRELSLPAVSGSPGDRVETELAEEGTRTSSSTGSLSPLSPALLEQYLAMPRARMIIDGYNVSKTAWPSSSLEAQRIRLLNGLAPVVARTGAETTVVFDAAATTNRPVVNTPRGVKVRFSPEGVIADDVIRDLVDAEPEGRVVIVVTNDQEVATDVVRAGARSVAVESLLGLIERSG